MLNYAASGAFSAYFWLDQQYCQSTSEVTNQNTWLACRYYHFLMDAAGSSSHVTIKNVKELGLQETGLLFMKLYMSVSI